MNNGPEWDRTRLDLNPAEDPPAPVAQPVGSAVEEEVVDPRERRFRVVRTVCTIINLICGLFAVVLGLHIILVLAGANPHNGFASFVDGWAGAVSLGLSDLFAPGNAKLAVLFNEGLAAIIWLLIAAALTYAIRQFALPGPRRAVRYRRHVVE
jgi:hypothetical protein